MWIVALGGCVVLNRRLRSAQPDARPYKWGYCVAILSLFTPINTVVMLSSGAAEMQGVDLLAPLSLISMVVTVLAGYWMFQRVKRGWYAYLLAMIIGIVQLPANLGGMQEMPSELDPEIMMNIIKFSFVIVFLIYGVLNFIYAKKRWHEFS